MEITEELKEKLENCNQLQLLDFIPLIKTEEEKKEYIRSLKEKDFSLISSLYSTYTTQKDSKNNSQSLIENFSPIKEQYSKASFTEQETAEFIQRGYDEINEGHIALFILSGGQGTRLGFDKPKGIFNIGMPSNKSLFEFLVNRFQSIQKLAQKKSNKTHKDSTLILMTSQENNNAISEFFKEKNYFGLDPKNVILIPQNNICGFGLDGKVINLTESKLYEAPDGNGGCFTAMKTQKIIEMCEERNISYINVVAIDNPLYKVLDPFYIGMTLIKGKFGLEQMSGKAIKKTSSSEKVGNFLNYKKHPMMKDYMEIPKSLLEAKNEKGELIFSACNLLDYIIGVKFLKKVLNDEQKFKELISMFHFIGKKTNCVILNENKEIEIKKDFPFIKLEIFFNSIFEFSEEGSLLLLEIERNDEFAPVKNKEGDATNTPSITKRKMSNLFKKWYTLNGGKILNDSENKILEISFLDCYDGNLENMFENNKNLPKEIDFKDKDEILIY